MAMQRRVSVWMICPGPQAVWLIRPQDVINRDRSLAQCNYLHHLSITVLTRDPYRATRSIDGADPLMAHFIDIRRCRGVRETRWGEFTTGWG
jgi:hypothetical protein